MKNTKDVRITLRMSIDLNKRLGKACDETGISQPEIIRNAIEAVIDSFEKEKKLTFPMTLKND